MINSEYLAPDNFYVLRQTLKTLKQDDRATYELLSIAIGKKQKPFRIKSTRQEKDLFIKLKKVIEWLAQSQRHNAVWLNRLTERGTPVKISYGFDKAVAEANMHLFGNKKGPSAKKNKKEKIDYIPVNETCLLNATGDVTDTNLLPLSPAQMAAIVSFDIKEKLLIHFHVSAQSKVFQFTVMGPHSKTHTTWVHEPHNSFVGFAGWGGTKITKQLFANRLALYFSTNCLNIRSNFGNVGAYAFGRYGFLPDQREWNIIRKRIQTNLDAVCSDNFIPAHRHLEIKKILSSKNPKSMWHFVDIPEKDTEGNSLAFTLITKNYIMWAGQFQISDPFQMARARNYTGPEKFDAAFIYAADVNNKRTMPAVYDMPEFHRSSIQNPLPVPAQMPV